MVVVAAHDRFCSPSSTPWWPCRRRPVFRWRSRREARRQGIAQASPRRAGHAVRTACAGGPAGPGRSGGDHRPTGRVGLRRRPRRAAARPVRPCRHPGRGRGARLPPGPLRYAERLVGHDAALRALTRWRVWLYDCLSPRVPAALAGWRSGDLLARAIDDVDALQDLYLRTLLPVAIAAGRRSDRHGGRRPHPALGRPRPRGPAPRRADRPRPAHLAPRRRRRGGRTRRLPLGPGGRRAGRGTRAPCLRRRCALPVAQSRNSASVPTRWSAVTPASRPGQRCSCRFALPSR